MTPACWCIFKPGRLLVAVCSTQRYIDAAAGAAFAAAAAAPYAAVYSLPFITVIDNYFVQLSAKSSLLCRETAYKQQ